MEKINKDEDIKKLIREEALKVVKTYSKSGFTARKLTDMPTDALQVVSRKYVTQNGTTANRPTSSVLGTQYFDTTLGFPVYWSGSTWVRYDGTAA